MPRMCRNFSWSASAGSNDAKTSREHLSGVRYTTLWLEQRQKQMAEGTLPGVVRREPVRNPTKVGRNEPCPCGSGKKYKQCHGSPDRLH